MSFTTQVHGKWILAGEHAVLRGCPALVFPLYSRPLQFKYIDSPQAESLRLELGGEHGEELQLLFWGVLEKACALKKISRRELPGQVHIQSAIPVGAGLGASAALSVAVARWFQHLQILSEVELLEFSRQLENLFHGESSGVDVAVALTGKPLRYVRGMDLGPQQNFQPQWQPQWYVSYSGKRGVTVECVNKVKAMIAKDPAGCEKIDQQMRQAVEQAEQALSPQTSLGQDQRQALLMQSMNLASDCFQRWNLIESNLQQHMQWLSTAGALAVKPTGSGDGGYVLSLWDRPPSPEVRTRLIPCFYP